MNIPTANLVIVAVAVIIIMGALIYTIRDVLHKSKIESLGPLKFQKEIKENIQLEQEAQSRNYFLDNTVKEYDNHLKYKLRNKTDSLNFIPKFIPIFSEFKTNNIFIYVAFELVVKSCLNNSLSNNHLTRVFQNKNKERHLSKLLDIIKNKYDIFIFQNSMHTSDELPPYYRIEKILEEFLNEWCKLVQAEVKETCEEKLETYQNYLPMFENDPYRKKILEICIEKNQGYLENLN